MRYHVCDFFLMRGTNIFSNMIAKGSRREEGMDFSHTLMSLTEGENPAVIEAVIPRVRIVPLSIAIEQAEYAICLRPVGWTEQQKAAAVKEALSHFDELYGFDNYVNKIPGVLLKKDYLSARQITTKWVDCAEFMGLVLAAAGYPMAKEAICLTPNDFNYFARMRPDLFARFLVPDLL